MNTLNFYHAMPVFSDFSNLVESACFFDVPESWVVVIADVKGSTDAIRSGRYKQVNIVGASSITCVINRLQGEDFPFVFGGDGATLLLPESKLYEATDELSALQSLAEERFGLKLRVGYVPLKTLYKEGHSLKIGKYQLSPGNSLAQFKGSALTRAEELIKSGGPGAISLKPKAEASPNLEGLSCRLNPMTSKNGTMLSLLVQPRADIKGEALEILLHDVLSGIKNIVGQDLKKVSPVDEDRLKWNLSSQTISDEISLQANGSRNLAGRLKQIIKMSAAVGSLSLNIPMGPFKPKQYKSELVTNSDFKKFDETLRMVIDCRLDQAKDVETFLDGMYREGKVYYGIHRSSEALMTCMVHSATNNRHVHFVDGADGGYAMASVGLKEQIKSALH